MKMRGVLFTLGSFAITGAVVGNAWMQKKQFFPTVVYLTKSSPCMAVLYVQAFVFVLLLGKLMRKVFFGQLRAAEMEHLIERSWYAVTDTCLAFTMFRDDFSPRFVASFTFLLFLKCFHWLAEDRIDYYAVLLTVLLTIALKYVLHSIDLQNENPWENKAVYMLYIELVTGFVRVILYICFSMIMMKIHTFPLFAIRPMYLTLRQFKKAVSDIILSRYPDATAEELEAGDSTCIICREEMVPPQTGAQQQGGRQNFSGVNKKLPCGHIFHAPCLRSWFQRQQTCPTCRLDVLVTAPPAGQNTPVQQPAANPQPGPPPPPPGPNPFQMFQAGMFLPPGVHNPQQAPPPASNNGTPTTASFTTTTAGGPVPLPMMMPPHFMLPPFMPPPPIPPAHYSGMSAEQLQAMEGMQRRSVEQRLECLSNINALLDAAMIQIAQYVTVARSEGIPGFQIPPPFTPTTHVSSPEEASGTSQSSTTTLTHSTTAAPSSTVSNSNGGSDQPSTSASQPQTTDAEVVEPEDPNELRRRRLARLDSANKGQQQDCDEAS